MAFPPVPAEIKSIAHVLKVADEHDNRNIVVSYWARMYACQQSMKLIPGKKPPEVSKLLMAIMDWLEETKKANDDVEGITNETIAHAMIEQYALQLFVYADGQDRQENFNKNMIKAFYTAGILMDILEQFGELTEDMINKRKYAKWKAAYIHNCLKTGDIPTAGGPDEHLNNVIDTTKSNENIEIDDPANQPSGSSDSAGSYPQPPSANNVTPPPANNLTPPYNPAPATTPVTPVEPAMPFVMPPQPNIPPVSNVSSTSNVNPEQIQKAQKYCKYATSALNYDDIKTAVENLQKALNLLQFGKED